MTLSVVTSDALARENAVMVNVTDGTPGSVVGERPCGPLDGCSVRGTFSWSTCTVPLSKPAPMLLVPSAHSRQSLEAINLPRLERLEYVALDVFSLNTRNFSWHR